MAGANVKGDGLAKLYDTLSLEERFKLRVRAMARGDTVDIDRLDRACPHEQYVGYCNRLDASDALTLMILVDLLPKLAKLDMLDVFREVVPYLLGRADDAAWMSYLDGYHAGWRAAGKRGEPPEMDDDELTAAIERNARLGRTIPTVLDDVARALARSARTPHDAFAAFCTAELGLSPDEVFGAWARPSLDTLTAHREALYSAEPDAEGLELLGNVLRLAWRQRGLNDPTADVDDELRARLEETQRGRT